MVINKDQPNNHPIYYVETKIGSSILFNDSSFEEKVPETDMTIKYKPGQKTEKISKQQNNAENEMWNMSFDMTIKYKTWLAEKEQGLVCGLTPPNQVEKFVLISFLLIAQITWLNMSH
jgi:hypothetical protein